MQHIDLAARHEDAGSGIESILIHMTLRRHAVGECRRTRHVALVAAAIDLAGDTLEQVDARHSSHSGQIVATIYTSDISVRRFLVIVCAVEPYGSLSHGDLYTIDSDVLSYSDIVAATEHFLHSHAYVAVQVDKRAALVRVEHIAEGGNVIPVVISVKCKGLGETIGFAVVLHIVAFTIPVVGEVVVGAVAATKNVFIERGITLDEYTRGCVRRSQVHSAVCDIDILSHVGGHGAPDYVRSTLCAGGTRAAGAAGDSAELVVAAIDILVEPRIEVGAVY